jgi:hypothetical protein
MKKKFILGMLVASMAFTTGCGWGSIFKTGDSVPEEPAVIAQQEVEPEDAGEPEAEATEAFENPFADVTEAPTLPDLDISGCDTFTQIVDSLEPGMAYTNATLGDADVLLVTNFTRDNSKGEHLATGALVYVYKDGVPTLITTIPSGGTYPLAVDQGMLYIAADSEVMVYTIQSNEFLNARGAWEDTNMAGEHGYFYQEGDEPTMQLEDDTTLQEFLELYKAADQIVFDVIQ